MEKVDPPLRSRCRLRPRCPWASLQPLAAGCGPECRFYLQLAGAFSQPPTRVPHLPLLPGRFFRWTPALPRPTLIKAWRKGREFLPAQVTPLSQFPTCSALPLWPGQGEPQGART